MTTHRARGEKALRSGWWQAGLLLLLAGCQTSPASVGGCDPKTANASRPHLLVKQLLRDTGEELVHQSLRAMVTVIHDQAGWVDSIGRGVFGKRIGMHLHGAPPPITDCGPPLDPAIIETNLEPALVQLYRNGGEALAILEQMIDSANTQIDVLMYTWDDDPVGWGVAQHLAARAGPDLRVRVLVDGGANLIFTPTPGGNASSGDGAASQSKPQISAGEINRVVCWLACQPHVELVRIRNPLAHFDHRKLVLIDGQAAWAGGRNFNYVSFFARHDVSYTLRGSLVCRLQQRFEDYWRDQGGKPGCLTLANLPVVANAAGRLVHNTPVEHSLRHALYHAMDCARSRVWMENPYLCDTGVIVKLAHARRRGADVRVVLTIRSDTNSINHANRVTANRLLAAGVRVYLYPGRVHTKCATVDGCWAYLGSGNFDLLSLRRNHEIGIVLGPGPVVTELEETLFLADFNPEWELHEPLPLSIQDYAYEMLADILL
jgi:cardiolipin synthase